MKYTVVYTKAALKSLKKIDNIEAKKLVLWINKNLVDCQDPRIHGSALKGNLKHIWRYKVGKYRILSTIHDEELVIDIVTVGHRKEVYK